jgi:hypothetical protein
MRTSQLFAAMALVVTLVALFPPRAQAGQTTDQTGSSHVMPKNDGQAPGQKRRLHGWIGVGVNAAVLIVKIAVPSIGRYPLTRS